MSTVTTEPQHDLRWKLAAESVDTAHGIIRTCTVAKAGVQATGKFYVAPDGKEYPIFTDQRTLETLMVAAKAAGKRVKVREDHVDEVGARAGYADEFKMTNDGRVTADIHLFKSFKHRDVVLETSLETPEEIGLSIDFIPSFELKDGRAMMRVEELNAVDIVDEGAITPDGLLLSSRVDTAGKVESPRISQTQPTDKMAASLDDIMAMLTEMKTGHAALAKTVGEMQTKLATAPAAVADPKVEEALKAANDAKTQLAAVTGTLAQMKKEKALLGFRGSSEERAKLASASVEDIEKAASEKKDYLALVAARVESAKCKKSEAHVWVMKNHQAEYAAHLAAKGVIRFQAA